MGIYRERLLKKIFRQFFIMVFLIVLASFWGASSSIASVIPIEIFQNIKGIKIDFSFGTLTGVSETLRSQNIKIIPLRDALKSKTEQIFFELIKPEYEIVAYTPDSDGKLYYNNPEVLRLLVSIRVHNIPAIKPHLESQIAVVNFKIDKPKSENNQYIDWNYPIPIILTNDLDLFRRNYEKNLSQRLSQIIEAVVCSNNDKRNKLEFCKNSNLLFP